MNPIQAIEEGLLAVQEPQGFPVRGSATGACPREIYQKLTGAPQRPHSARDLRVFKLGHQRGEHLANALARSLDGKEGRKVTLEAEVWTWLPIYGDAVGDVAAQVRAWALERRADPELIGVRSYPGPSGEEEIQVRSRIDVLWAGNHAGTIIECKTADVFQFKKLEEDGPSESYLLQVACQAQGLMQTWGLNVDEAWIVYEAKGSDYRAGFQAQDLRAFPVPLDETLWSRLNVALEGVAQALLAWVYDHKDAPPPVRLQEAMKGGVGKLPWQCDYCAVGPLEGGCAPAGRLTSQTKNGVPRWTLT